MRLFIAINFHEITKGKLLALRDQLKNCSECGNFSLPENIHLTLSFLGECDERQAASVKEAMDAASFQPFDLTIERIGRFKRNSGDIWWAGVGESKALLALQSELTDNLTGKGFLVDQRKYSPHITLGREVTASKPPWQIQSFTETVSAIDLMKSERVGGKLTYTPIHIKKAENR